MARFDVIKGTFPFISEMAAKDGKFYEDMSNLLFNRSRCRGSLKTGTIVFSTQDLGIELFALVGTIF
jgi:hypothetical protein